jgi:hypothetical protein
MLALSSGAPARPLQSAIQQTRIDKKELTVYITRTGKRYHRANCRYLSHSKIPVSLNDAKAHGYTPCHVCNPPE